MVASIVEYEDHAPSGCLLAQQSPQEVLKGRGVEDRTHHAYELACTQGQCGESRIFGQPQPDSDANQCFHFKDQMLFRALQ